jgi:hypothetical protein
MRELLVEEHGRNFDCSEHIVCSVRPKLEANDRFPIGIDGSVRVKLLVARLPRARTTHEHSQKTVEPHRDNSTIVDDRIHHHYCL